MTPDEIYLELEKIKNSLENILGNLPDESKEWESIEILLTQAEKTLEDLNHG